jgi:hypothetical protein
VNLGIACVAVLPDLTSFPFFETWGFEIVKFIPESAWGAAAFYIAKRSPHPGK